MKQPVGRLSKLKFEALQLYTSYLSLIKTLSSHVFISWKRNEKEKKRRERIVRQPALILNHGQAHQSATEKKEVLTSQGTTVQRVINMQLKQCPSQQCHRDQKELKTQ